MSDLTQERFKRHKPVSVDKDSGKMQVPLSPLVGGKTKVMEVELSGVKHLIRKSVPAPRGWYKDKHVKPTVRPRPCYAEAMLTLPYSGYCFVNCAFCYVNFGMRGYKSTLLPTVNASYPDQIDKQLSKMTIAPIAYISSFTEPFHQLEEQYHVTQRLAEVLAKHKLPLFFLSRRIPPDWAEEALLNNSYSYMQWSINTSNQDDLRRLCPGGFSLAELLLAVERYSKLGIYTSFQINPVLPGITTLDEIIVLVRALAEAGGKHVIFKFCEIGPAERKLLLERLRAWKLDGVGEFEAILNEIIGHEYYVQQSLRVSWLKTLLSLTRSLGITMSLCYEYYRDGKAGGNLAPWFTTSDQCHGPAVPIFYRPEIGEDFQPLPGCYRKGCLYCEEHGTRACDNETLLQAKALEYKHYRDIKLVGQGERWSLPDSCPPEHLAASRGKNPGLATDAELWGLFPVEKVL